MTLTIRVLNIRASIKILESKSVLLKANQKFSNSHANIKGISSATKNFNIFPNTSLIRQDLRLCPQAFIVEAKRQTSFFNRLTAEELWKGVTSVSNAGKKRGRGKGNRRIFSKNLNKGQRIGFGEENVVWPGLNAPVLRGKEIVKQEKLPKDENRFKKILEVREKMGVFRPLKLSPLERGWSGTKLPGRSIGPPDPIGEDNFKGFDTKVLEMKTVCKMDAIMGRKRRQSIFVVTGNKNGLAGYALTKANTIKDAVRKSKNLAGQRLVYIERCDGHTVFHDFFCEYFQTKIFVKRKPEGYGLVCHRAIKEICLMIGIKNLHAKIEGSTNVQNITKAFFHGLLKQSTHQKLAEDKKLHVVKVRPGCFPEVVASPTDGEVRSRKDIPMDEEMDFKLYTMERKVEIERKPFVPFYTRLPSFETHLKKVLKSRNHEKIKRQLILEYGEIASQFTADHPECRPNFRPDKE